MQLKRKQIGKALLMILVFIFGFIKCAEEIPSDIMLKVIESLKVDISETYKGNQAKLVKDVKAIKSNQGDLKAIFEKRLQENGDYSIADFEKTLAGNKELQNKYKDIFLVSLGNISRPEMDLSKEEVIKSIPDVEIPTIQSTPIPTLEPNRPEISDQDTPTSQPSNPIPNEKPKNEQDTSQSTPENSSEIPTPNPTKAP